MRRHRECCMMYKARHEQYYSRVIAGMLIDNIHGSKATDNRMVGG